MEEKSKPITIPIEIEYDEEKLQRIKQLLDEIITSGQEVKELFKQFF